MNTSFDKTTGTPEWYTPPYLIELLGPFDLDPCSPMERPWDTAKVHYNKKQDGLAQEWKGFTFMNPPYGRETFKWMEKLAKHNNGIALIFARTDTIGFHKEIFNKADAILFIKGRIRFYKPDGTQGDAAGAPSCLVAYGEHAVKKLEEVNISGRLVYLNKTKAL